jgi:AcrR family transcriptional regulator
MDDYSQQLMTLSSRERLLRAAMALFASQGFRRTTVGEIEAEAGFTPRGGTLYKHFTGKHALLAEAVERHIAEVEAVRRQATRVSAAGDPAAVKGLALALLRELESERDITAFLEKEGDSFPLLRDRFYDALIEPGFTAASALISASVAHDKSWDPDATAVIVVGALVNYVRNQWTFGEVPLGVTPERLADSLVKLLDLAAGSGSA